MSRSFALLTLIFLFVGLLGCTRKSPIAHKEIQVPDGGPPVLTTAERAARGIQKPPEPRRVAQAAYLVPADSTIAQGIRPLEQWSDQDAAEDALGRIGAPAVPALVDALRSTDPSVRKKSVEVLGRMGEDAAPAVPALTALLDDPDLGVRKAAARTLGQIGPEAKDAVPALMRNLFQPPALEAPPETAPPQQANPLQSVPQ